MGLRIFYGVTLVAARDEKENHRNHLGFSGLVGVVDGFLEVIQIPVLKWTSRPFEQPSVKRTITI
jgi:hypothetical protein